MTSPRLPDPDATQTHVGDTRLFPPGHRVADRYRIVGMLGMGGMGVVYRAHDEQLGVDVALKALRPDRVDDPALLERFRQEILLARQVSHPNVVRIHDLGRDGELRFFTMDYVEGEPLKDVLRREGCFDWQRATALVRELAEALAVAHRYGVVHRDLKPANVLLDEAGHAYITDFGIAHSMTSGSGLTRAGDVMGTPDYLSPEQARGETVDPRSDLYALGILYFEMLAGRLPFPGGSFPEMLARRISGHPLTFAECDAEPPAPVAAVVERLLQRDPDDRYDDADELVRALDEAVAEVTVGPGERQRPQLESSPPEALASDRPRSGRSGGRAGVLGAALLVLLGLGAVGAWWWLRPTAEPASAAAAIPPAVSVAVLPLEDDTGDASLAWAGAGAAELVTQLLAESPALRVTDSLRVLRTVGDLQLDPGSWSRRELGQLAELLDVDRMVVGRLYRSSQGRLHAEGTLWQSGERLRRQERFAVETGPEGTVGQLVDRLGARLRDALAVREEETAEAPAVSAEALSRLTRGVQLLSRGASVEAEEELSAAVEAAPDYGAAWLRLASARQLNGRREEALEAVRRAVDELPEGSGRLSFEARARAAELAGDLDRAVTVRREMVETYPHDVEARRSLGETLGEQGRLGEAVEVLTAVVEEEPNHPRAWFLLGKFAILGGEVRRAVDEYLVRALVIQNRLDNDQGRADVTNALGVAYQNLGELDEAAHRYGEAAETRRRIGDRRGLANSLTNLAFVRFQQGRDGEAREHLDQGREIQRRLGDVEGEAANYNTLGALEEERGRYRAALDAYREALELRRRLGDERALAESLNNVGFANYLLGEYTDAGVYWERALELYRSRDNPEGEALTLQSLGQLRLARGEWNGALRAFLEALETARELELPGVEAVSVGYLGRVAQFQGRFSAAMASYAQALALLEPLRDLRGLAEFTLYRASLYLDLGRLEDAGADLDRARGWLSEAANESQRSTLRQLEGRLALARGDLPTARAAFTEARKQAAEAGDPVAEGLAALGLGEVASAAGDPAAATTVLEPLETSVRRLGHVALEVRVGAALAAARLAAADAPGAEASARRALRTARDNEPVAEAYRLHWMLAEALAAQGRDDEAARERRAAREDVERLREGLSEDVLRSFDRRPDIRRTRRSEAIERSAA